MCDPITVGSVTLGASSQLAIASGAANLMGSMSAVNAQNQAALNNAAAARRGAANEQNQEMESYVETNRSMLLASMDRVLQARSLTDLSMVSAIENGAGGQTMMDALSERNSVAARNIYRDRLERESLKTQTGRNLNAIREKAAGRIASVPTTRLNMGHIAQAGSQVAQGFM
jgi:CHASE3 domain sensor protein